MNNDNPNQIQSLFRDRLLNEWLPTYCYDAERKYSTEGFNLTSIKVMDEDANDFMRGMDNSVITDIGGGRFTMPKSKATEVIFWEGSKSKTPRSINLWLEPVITIAAISRLHLDYHWPKEFLGMQSKNWKFDLVVYESIDSDSTFIAGEIKKTTKELDQLISNLIGFDNKNIYDYKILSSSKINAHKKWLGLLECRAPYFWAVGPGNDSRLYKITYSSDGNINFEACSTDLLVFKFDKYLWTSDTLDILNPLSDM